MPISYNPTVPSAERAKLIERLRQLGYPEPEVLFDSGVRHPEYSRLLTKAELLALPNIGKAGLAKIRSLAGEYNA